MTITKNQLVVALLNNETIKPGDRIHRITVEGSYVEVGYEVVEPATGFTAPQTLKMYEDDIGTWGIDVKREGTSRIIT